MIDLSNLYAKINLNRLTAERIDYVRKLGLNMELCVTDTTFLFEKFESVSGSIKDKILETGINTIIHLPFYGLQLGCVDQYIRSLSKDLLLKGIARGLELGITKGVMHIAVPQNIPDSGKKRWIKTFIVSMGDIIEVCEQKKFTLYLENTWEQDIQIMEDIFLLLNSNGTAMCLDIAHIYCFSKNSFSEWWELYASRIKHIHLSDNNYDQDSHLPLGEGSIDFAAIIRRIVSDSKALPDNNRDSEASVTFTIENDIEDLPKTLSYLRAKNLLNATQQL